ncbi:UNVERIFIED_CONTAM: hypothetical protein HDU68_011674 [Siphonaria sp. JEL0065]|nr:hypothetical protein HDU68_011674 [Siphonaria sp. JEL0065]
MSAIGVICHLFLPEYSTIYAILLSLWGIAFIAVWKRQEFQLADSWHSIGSSKRSHKRPQFVPERIVRDAATGQEYLIYSPWKRWLVHLTLTLPVILFFATLVVLISVIILTTQIYTSEVYAGPYPSVVSMSPVLLYVLSLPQVSTLYNILVRQITHLENSRFVDEHEASLTRKSFILTFLLTHLSLFLVGAIYIPISDLILPFLSSQGVPHLTLSREAQANLLSPASLRGRVIYFCITGQVVNQASEVILPALSAWWNKRHIQKEIKKNASVNWGGLQDLDDDETTFEQKLQKRIKHALALPVYSLYEDFAELANQFADYNVQRILAFGAIMLCSK